MRLCDDRLYGNRTLSRPFVSLFPALPLCRFTRPLCHQSTELNPPSSFVDHDMRLFLCPNYTPVVERASRTVYWPPSSSIHPIQSRRAIPTLPANYGGGGRANRESKKPRSCGSAAEAKPIRAKREKKKGSMLDRALRPGLAHIEQSACMTRIRLSPLSARLVAGTKRSLGIWPPARRWRLESSPSPRAHLTIDSNLDVASTAAMCVCVAKHQASGS